MVNYSVFAESKYLSIEYAMSGRYQIGPQNNVIYTTILRYLHKGKILPYKLIIV